jgi:hypothetical protein
LGLGSAVLGLAVLVACGRGGRRLANLLVGAAVQAMLIILADRLKGYWFVYRQIIHLTPAVLFLSALGLDATVRQVAQRVRGVATWQMLAALRVGLALAVGLTAAPRLSDYYAYAKSTGGSVATALARAHQPGEPVLVIPGNETKIYAYYLAQLRSEAVAHDLRPATWEGLAPSIASLSGRVFLVAPAGPPFEKRGQLAALGFTPVYTPSVDWLGAQWLFVRATPR